MLGYLFPKHFFITSFVILFFNLNLFPLPVPNTTPVIAAEYAAFISDYVYILKRHIKVCCSLLLKKLFSNFIFYVFFASQLPNALLLPTLLFFFNSTKTLGKCSHTLWGAQILLHVMLSNQTCILKDTCKKDLFPYSLGR